MQSSLLLLHALSFLPTLITAHYNFPALISNGVVQADWQHVRRRGDIYSNGFHDDVNNVTLRCGLTPSIAPSVLSVAAGGLLGFRIDEYLGHPGPALVYLAKAPTGQTAKTFNGDGQVWFKIAELGPTFNGLAPPNNKVSWAADNLRAVNFTIPAATPPGDYLVRFEHIALHSAGALKGAQFYVACGQITVTGTGRGTPGPLVAIPGAYKANDPGVLVSLWWPPLLNYTIPGPAVWRG